MSPEVQNRGISGSTIGQMSPKNLKKKKKPNGKGEKQKGGTKVFSKCTHLCVVPNATDQVQFQSFTTHVTQKMGGHVRKRSQ